MPISLPAVEVYLQDEKTSFMRINEIDQELNAIFLTPGSLTRVKQIEHNRILREIDKIYIKNSSNQIDEIYNQIDSLYCDDKPNKQILSFLKGQLDDLFFNNSSTNITVEDEQRLSRLNDEINALYNEKEPTINELFNAEVLFNEKEELFASVFLQRSL